MKTFSEALLVLRKKKEKPDLKTLLEDQAVVTEIVNLTQQVQSLKGGIAEAVTSALTVGIEIGKEMMRDEC